MTDRLDWHRLSLRHYLGNQGRPIFNLLLKNRSIPRLPFQIIKTLLFQTTLTRQPRILPSCRRFDRIGIAVTYNQFVALSECCDVVISLDRRGYDAGAAASKVVKFDLAFTPKFIFELCKTIFQCLSFDRGLLRYSDIIARQKCFGIDEFRQIYLQSNKPLYVSNLNNPLILYLKTVLGEQVSWGHVPHAALGNTVFPDLSFVRLYIAYDSAEMLELKKSGWRSRIYCRRQRLGQSFKPSIPGNYFILLPKNYWDVDAGFFSSLRDAKFTVKFHPSTSWPLRVLWRIYFFLNSHSFVREVSGFQLDSHVLSASTSAVFQALGEGKCVFKLPLKRPSFDHYGFDSKLLDFNSAETEENFERQKGEILNNV